jgi:hypothetical protein
MSARGEPWWAGALLAAIVLGALAIFAWRSLPDTGFWYDETMQFWMARGVDGFAAPGTGGDGRLRSVIKHNARGNLDPGGFSLLLHVWLRAGADPVWLRSLPFGLFLGGLLAMAGLGWTWRRSLTFAVLGAAVPLGFPLLLYHATELRAYTMEFAGVAVGCLLLHRLWPVVTVPGLALLGVALAVFMSSRYSYTIFVASVCLVLVPSVWSEGGRNGRARLWRILALGGPVAAGAAFILVNLWLQHARMTFEGGRLIDYLVPSTAAGKSARDLVRAATANLLSPVAIPVTVAALVALVPAGWRARLPAGLRSLGASPESRAMYWLAPPVLALSAALWRWHPWDVSRKWSLFLHALSAVLILRLAADIAAWLRPAIPHPGPRAAWARRAGPAIAALAIVALSVHAATQRRTHWNDLTATLRHLETVPLAPGSVAVEGHPYPTLRYLCEYGPFVGRLPYPAPFRPPQGPGSGIGPETRYIIAYVGPEALARLHPGHRFRSEPSWPRHLYRVEPATGP